MFGSKSVRTKTSAYILQVQGFAKLRQPGEKALRTFFNFEWAQFLVLSLQTACATRLKSIQTVWLPDSFTLYDSTLILNTVSFETLTDGRTEYNILQIKQL